MIRAVGRTKRYGDRVAVDHADFTVAAAPEKLFAPWTGFTVFVLEVLVLLIVGAILVEKRDA